MTNMVAGCAAPGNDPGISYPRSAALSRQRPHAIAAKRAKTSQNRAAGGHKPTIMDGPRSRLLLQRLAVLADVDVLTAAIVMRDVDAPPLPPHFFVMHFGVINFGRGADLGHAETADG